jgi:hypothetical protein
MMPRWRAPAADSLQIGRAARGNTPHTPLHRHRLIQMRDRLRSCARTVLRARPSRQRRGCRVFRRPRPIRIRRPALLSFHIQPALITSCDPLRRL